MIDEIALIEKDISQDHQQRRDLATEATDKLKQYNKLYYDKRHKVPSKYRVGDYVLVRDLQPKPGESRKIKPKYRGQYVIAKTLDKNRYVVTDIPGFNITAKPYNTILSTDKLKYWIKPTVV